MLEAFGAEDRDKPESLVRSLLADTRTPHQYRTFYDLKKNVLLRAGTNNSKWRVQVLSSQAASTAFRSLLGGAFSAQCIAAASLQRAAERWIDEVGRAQQQQQYAKPLPPDELLRLADSACQLATTVLDALSSQQRLSDALTPGLSTLCGAVGETLRVRNAAVASRCVKTAKTELTLSALAQYTNEAYLARVGEPASVALFRRLLGCGAVRAERADKSHARNVFAGLENLDATHRQEQLRTAACVTVVDCVLKTTNSAFISPRSFLVASDMLTVSGKSLVIV